MISHIRAALRRLAPYQISIHGANASFFIIFSIFPLAALLVTLLQFLPISYEDLLYLISDVVPETLLPVVDYILYETFRSNATAIISVSGVLALWSASRGVYGILTGLNAIFGAPEGRTYFYRRGAAVLYTFLLLIALVFTLVLQVFGQYVETFLVEQNLLSRDLVSLILELRFVFTIALLALIFTLILAVFPARRIKLSNAISGALFTAVGWVGFTQLFSIYVSSGGGSQFYGSMSVVLLTMLWLYVCMCILFYGGVLCHILEEPHGFKKFFQIPPETTG